MAGALQDFAVTAGSFLLAPCCWFGCFLRCRTPARSTASLEGAKTSFILAFFFFSVSLTTLSPSPLLAPPSLAVSSARCSLL